MKHWMWVLIVGGLATWLAIKYNKILSYVIGGVTLVAAFMMFRKGV